MQDDVHLPPGVNLGISRDQIPANFVRVGGVDVERWEWDEYAEPKEPGRPAKEKAWALIVTNDHVSQVRCRVRMVEPRPTV